jgi:hypothetical protein
MRLAQSQVNDWMVFVEGVQVPIQSFSVTFGADAPTRGSVALEPDALLTKIRPGAVIAIFCRDRYPDNQNQRFLDQWFYYAGGEVDAVLDERTPQSRSMQLSFVSEVAYLQRHQAFASMMGGTALYGTVAGTVLIPPFGVNGGPAISEPWFKMALFSATFAQEHTTLESGTYRGGDISKEGFGQRILRMMAWLSAHNASVRMHAARTRLFSRIAGIDDKLLQQAVTAQIARSSFQHEFSAHIDASLSLYDICMSVARFGGYRFLSVPMPIKPTAQPTSAEQVPLLAGMQIGELVTPYRNWYRNDFIFAPHLYYAPPPPCNLIFPDMLASRRVERIFTQEPTRTLYEDNLGGTQLLFVESGGAGYVPAGKTPKHPGEYWGNIISMLQPAKQPAGSDTEDATGSIPNTVDLSPSDSAYRAPSVQDYGSGINLLETLGDDELERGVVLKQQRGDAELMMAALPDRVALTDGLTKLTDGGAVYVPEAWDNIKQQLPQSADGNNYLTYIQEWLRFQHRLARRTINTAFSLRGHRWIVPGFTSAVLGGDVSYLGYVESVSFSYTALGVEDTVVQMTHVRPLTSLPDVVLSSAKASSNKADQLIQEARRQVIAAYDAVSDIWTGKLQRMQRASAELIRRDAAVAAAPTAAAAARITAASEPVAKEYDQLYIDCVGQAHEYYLTAYGPRRDPGAVYSVTDDSILATELAKFEIGPETKLRASAADRRVAALTEATSAVRAIERYNELQADQYENKKPSAAPTQNVVEAINSSKSLILQAEQVVRAAVRAIEREEANLIPPSFYNPNYLQFNTIDKIYQELLGCKPFYTSQFAAGLTTSQESDPAVASASAHQALVRLLSRVFPALQRSSLVAVPADVDTKFSGWDAAVSDPTTSTMEWQHRTLLKRSATTLGTYLKDHGFEPDLEEFVSDEPDPRVFYRMKPVASPAAVLSVYGQAWPWDDSVICRLVDERAMVGKAADPAVAERRAQVLNPAVTGEFRQQLILAYARRHFGGRAIGGD